MVETLRETTQITGISESWRSGTPAPCDGTAVPWRKPVPAHVGQIKLSSSRGIFNSVGCVQSLKRGVFDAPLTPLHQILDQRDVVSFEQHHTRHTTLHPPSYRCSLTCHMAFSGTFMDGCCSAWQ